jgi:hypothetical protein
MILRDDSKDLRMSSRGHKYSMEDMSSREYREWRDIVDDM